MSAQRKGNEVRKVCTVRLEPTLIIAIIAKYGSFTAWINHVLKKEKLLKTKIISSDIETKENSKPSKI